MTRSVLLKKEKKKNLGTRNRIATSEVKPLALSMTE